MGSLWGGGEGGGCGHEGPMLIYYTCAKLLKVREVTITLL